MKKRIKELVVVLLLLITTTVYAIPYETLEKENVKPIGDTIIRTNQTLENKSFNSERPYENSILIKESSKVTLKNPTITKSEGKNNDVGEQFGVNSAILVMNKSSLNLVGGSIKTDGDYSNGVYSYVDSNVIVRNTHIRTLKPNSNGLMVSGEGEISASNLKIETLGSSASVFKTFGQGGSITVDKGTYSTSGVGSPVIYSRSNIEVKNAILKANKSEGVTIEGSSNVKLNKVSLESSNITTSNTKEKHKNIFIYYKGDKNSVEPSKFKAKNSTITTNQGSTFLVTNTKTVIDLENNNIENKSGDFLKVLSDNYGDKNNNGGDVTLNMSNQSIEGNIIMDKVSTLSMNMEEKSFYEGVINGNNNAYNIALTIDSDSVLVLKGDSYVTSLNNSDSNNSNIYLNGHKMYVGGKEITANNDRYKTSEKVKKVKKEESRFESIMKTIIPILKGTGVLAVVILIVMFFVYLNNRKHNKMY